MLGLPDQAGFEAQLEHKLVDHFPPRNIKNTEIQVVYSEWLTRMIFDDVLTNIRWLSRISCDIMGQVWWLWMGLDVIIHDDHPVISPSSFGGWHGMTPMITTTQLFARWSVISPSLLVESCWTPNIFAELNPHYQVYLYIGWYLHVSCLRLWWIKPVSLVIQLFMYRMYRCVAFIPLFSIIYH